MASDVRTITGQPEARQEKRRGFHPFVSMAEGLRNRRARRDTLEALESAMRFGEKDSFEDALSSFTAMAPEQKQKVLLALQESLKPVSYYPFEDERKTARLTVVAEFFSRAATLLPVDAEGERVTAPYKETIRMLRDIVEREDMRLSANTSHSYAILVCAKALWELEFGNFDFWEGRAHDVATQDYVITKLLEMPETADVTEHGWYLLRGNLDAFGPAIARNPSPKRDEFFASMFMDGDEKVVASALRCAICLEKIPGELYGIAGELSQAERLGSLAQDFTMAGRFKEQLAGTGEDRLTAAKRLAVFYADGLKNLNGVLERTAREMVGEAALAQPLSQDHLKRLEVLVHMSAVGISPYSPDELAALLGPLVGTRAGVAVFYNLTQNLMAFSQRSDLKAAAAELESARVNACFDDLAYVDDRQFEAAHELVLLFSTGRLYLVENGMIPHLAQEMVEMLIEPSGETDGQKQEQAAKAQKVLDHMRQVGIDVQINNGPAGAAVQPEDQPGIYSEEAYREWNSTHPEFVTEKDREAVKRKTEGNPQGTATGPASKTPRKKSGSNE